jgi:hypothetical protein
MEEIILVSLHPPAMRVVPVVVVSAEMEVL